MAQRLKPHREKKPLRQKLTWLKLQIDRWFYDRKNLKKDINNYILKNEKSIRRFLLKLLIIGVIILLIGFLIDITVFSFVTVYKDGVPILGPGAKQA